MRIGKDPDPNVLLMDPDLIENSGPHPRQNKKSDPDPHQNEKRARMQILTWDAFWIVCIYSIYSLAPGERCASTPE